MSQFSIDSSNQSNHHITPESARTWLLPDSAKPPITCPQCKQTKHDTFPFSFNYDISYLIDQIRIFLAYKAILDSKRNLPLKVKLNLFSRFGEAREQTKDSLAD